MAPFTNNILSMKLVWIGGPTFTLELGAFAFVADPVLGKAVNVPGGPSERLSEVPRVNVPAPRFMLLSRCAPDHVDAPGVETIDKSTPVYAPPEAADDVRRLGFDEVNGLSWGETTTIESSGERLRITATPAHRAAAGSPSNGNGYFMSHEAGERTRTVFWTGDTVMTEDIRQVQQTHGYVDLLVVNVGAERDTDGHLVSADAKQAMQIVFRMQPKRIVPVHHTTFAHYTEPIGVFADQAGRTMYDKKLVALAEGTMFER